MSFPVWKGNDDFKQAMDQMVKQPFLHPERFHPLIFPIRHMVAVYGRQGVGKRTAVTSYCDSIGLVHMVVDVDFAQTSTAIQQIDEAVAGARALKEHLQGAVEEEEGDSEDRQTRVNSAIIINRADILAFEPDNEASMLFSLRLARIARANDMMFICLFSRVDTEESGNHLLPPATKNFRRFFFQQFRSIVYLPPPHEDFRKEFFAHMLEKFALHHNTTPSGGEGERDLVIVNLNFVDYKSLAQDSAYATTQNMLDFLQRLFYDVSSDAPPVICRPVEAQGKGPMTITRTVLESYMKHASGHRFILDSDPRVVENKFSVACGKGPIPGLRFDQQEAIAKLDNVSNFNKDNIDPEVVAEKIQRKKKKNGKNKKRMRREDEPEEGEEAEKAILSGQQDPDPQDQAWDEIRVALQT